MKRFAPAIIVAVMALVLGACSGTYTLPNTEPKEGTSYYKVVREGNNIVVTEYTPEPTTSPSPTPTPTITPTPTPTPTTPSPTPTPPPSGVANIRDYGATSDDGGDDGPAIRAACASGLPVFVPAGHYDAGSLTIPAGVKMTGEGSSSWIRASFYFNSNSSFSSLRIGDVGDIHAPAVRSTTNISFARVTFDGGGVGTGAIVQWNNRSVDGLTFTECTFDSNNGVWTSSGAAGALAMAVDTGDGTIIRNVTVERCHFLYQPTFGIVFWQSEEAGTGWWGDIFIRDNVFEVTGEFTLDFDGLYMDDRGHNNVIVTGNTVKGAGLPHNGVQPSWPYGICTEPARAGTLIENNYFGRCNQTPIKLTKDSTDVVVKNNYIDLVTPNGVSLIWPDYFRTINVFEGSDNSIAYNRIVVPSGAHSNQVIYDAGVNTSIIGNTIGQ